MRSIYGSPLSGEPGQQPPYARGSSADDPNSNGGAADPNGGGQGGGSPYGGDQGAGNPGDQGAGDPYGGGPHQGGRYGQEPPAGGPSGSGGGPYAAGQGQYGQAPYGQGQYGQGPYAQGQGQYGQGPYAQGPYAQGQGQGQYGQGSYTQGPYGQGQYGQGSSGQGPYTQGQGQYGQGSYTQGPYGQGQYGQGPYGQDPYGYGGPAGPGGPYGYGYGPGGPQGPRSPARRLRRGMAITAVALVAGLGTFFALGGGGSTGSGATLTTSQIEAQTDPALVDVTSTLGYQQAESLGTGLVLTSSGEILTNNHVIEGATSIKVTDIGNGRSYNAKVVGYDQTKDIAVLQLQNASGLKTVKLGNSDTAAVGQNVVALGNAGGKGGTPSVATGQITALNKSITASDEGSGTTEQLTGLINHNAPIQPGDSGGPLVSTTGDVIGIDTAAGNAMQFQSQQSQQTSAFAIPINEALAIGNQIEKADGSSTVHIGATGFLGVEVESAGNAAQQGIQTGSGAAVEGVLQGTPAARAGLSQGDVITSVDGRSVSSPASLQKALEQHHPGDKVRIGWTDQTGQGRSASMTLSNGPAA